MSPLPCGTCAMWLSVKPEFAFKILDGIKNVELRRQIPRFEPGGLVILYATSPKKAIVGAFRLDCVEIDKPSVLWSRLSKYVGLDKKRYEQYFDGSDRAVGLHIGNRWRLESPVLLDEIRESWPDFMPPQSYRYISYSNEQGRKMSLSLDDRVLGPLSFI